MAILSIDCGGDGYQSFKPDDEKYVKGEKSFSHNGLRDIPEASQPQAHVLRSHRWSQASFRYELPVTKAGTYEVELWFAEVWDGAFANGRRVFSANVKGDGDGAASQSGDLDVFAQVGANKLLAKKFEVSAEKSVSVDLVRGSANYPMISGIIIRPVDKDTKPPVSSTGYPTAEQLENTKKKIDAYGEKVRNSGIEIRGANYPYHMFHPASFKPYGTVLLFHGFSGANYGQRILAYYLYKSGFNIVNGMLAGHPYFGAHWPQVNIAEKYGGKALKQKLQNDPVIQDLMAGGDGRGSTTGTTGSQGAGDGTGEFNPAHMPRLFERIGELEPRFKSISRQEYIKAINDDNDPKFDDIFDSTHMDYLKIGQEQLDLLSELPGEVFTCGLSVGGAVAIALAAANPGRVTRCFSAAPLLEVHEYQPNTTRLMVNAIGPLGIREFAWDPNNPFPMACLTANGRFGGYITNDQKGIETFKSGKCKLFLCLTELEDAADIPTNRKYFEDVGGKNGGHDFYLYKRERRVPHPLIDPTQQSQGTTNRFYRSLYAEVYRFLRGGRVNTANMELLEVKEEGIPEVPEGVFGWAFYRDL